MNEKMAMALRVSAALEPLKLVCGTPKTDVIEGSVVMVVRHDTDPVAFIEVGTREQGHNSARIYFGDHSISSISAAMLRDVVRDAARAS